MTYKLLFNPQRGKVLQGLSRHAEMVRVGEFDKMVRALYFPELNVIYFRFWTPTGNYAFPTAWDEQRSKNACERALAAFKDREAVPEDVKVLFWETGYGVRDIDVKY